MELSTNLFKAAFSGRSSFAYYKEDLAIIEIKSGEIIKGYIPNDQYLIAKRFIEENRNILLPLWEEDPQNFDRF